MIVTENSKGFMKKADKEKLKRILETTIKAFHKQDAPDLHVDEDGDEIDQAQGNLLVGMMYEQRHRRNERVVSLSEALEKMKDNSYGLCEECGEDIGVRRLEVCPDAKFCIRCAEVFEKERRAYGRS